MCRRFDSGSAHPHTPRKRGVLLGFPGGTIVRPLWSAPRRCGHSLCREAEIVSPLSVNESPGEASPGLSVFTAIATAGAGLLGGGGLHLHAALRAGAVGAGGLDARAVGAIVLALHRVGPLGGTVVVPSSPVVACGWSLTSRRRSDSRRNEQHRAQRGHKQLSHGIPR